MKRKSFNRWLGAIIILIIVVVLASWFMHVYNSTPAQPMVTKSLQAYRWVPFSQLGTYSGVYTYSEKEGHVFVGEADRKTAAEIPNANLDTFSVAVDEEGSTTAFSKDDKNVYFFNGGDCCYLAQIQSGIDPHTFEVLPGLEYTKDSKAVYIPTFVPQYDGETFAALAGADAQSFSVIGGPPYDFAADKNHIYFRGAAVDVDRSTFVPLLDSSGNESPYAKDTQHVYTMTQSSEITVMPGADPKTFHLKYYPEGCFDGIVDDPTSTNVQCSYDAADNKYTYANGQMLQ